MKIFAVVILVATIVGGFVGGELAHRAFSMTGAVVAGLGVAAILLGLGAYFDLQDRRRRKASVPDDVRAVFDRMLKGPANRSPKASTAAPAALPESRTSHSGDVERSYLSSVFGLLSVQLLPKYRHPSEAFSTLMTNKRASGYIF